MYACEFFSSLTYLITPKWISPFLLWGFILSRDACFAMQFDFICKPTCAMYSWCSKGTGRQYFLQRQYKKVELMQSDIGKNLRGLFVFVKSPCSWRIWFCNYFCWVMRYGPTPQFMLLSNGQWKEIFSYKELVSPFSLFLCFTCMWIRHDQNQHCFYVILLYLFVAMFQPLNCNGTHKKKRKRNHQFFY